MAVSQSTAFALAGEVERMARKDRRVAISAAASGGSPLSTQ
jgi:hypothetical protein